VLHIWAWAHLRVAHLSMSTSTCCTSEHEHIYVLHIWAWVHLRVAHLSMSTSTCCNLSMSTSTCCTSEHEYIDVLHICAWVGMSQFPYHASSRTQALSNDVTWQVINVTTKWNNDAVSWSWLLSRSDGSADGPPWWSRNQVLAATCMNCCGLNSCS